MSRDFIKICLSVWVLRLLERHTNIILKIPLCFRTPHTNILKKNVILEISNCTNSIQPLTEGEFIYQFFFLFEA